MVTNVVEPAAAQPVHADGLQSWPKSDSLPAMLQPLALYLGTWKAETSRRLLRRLVVDGTVREQAEICLQWISEAASH